jgi:hypothetical protein
MCSGGQSCGGPVVAEKRTFTSFAERKEKFFALFQEASQERVRADLRTFFGPNADVYLETYDKMRARGGKFPTTWHWTAFLTVFPWFFYRKMYAVGAVLVFLPPAFAFFLGPSPAGSAALACAGMFAKGTYVQMGLGRILQADALELSGPERSRYLERAGGVSVIAGALAGFVFVAMLGLAILALFAPSSLSTAK